MRRLLTLAVALAALAGEGSAAAAPAPPSKDPFYAYSGSLTNVAPGTVLRTRQVSLSLIGAPAAVPATQVLYRTRNQLGRPIATVATIVRPALPLAPVKLLSYQTFYDGLADTCRPSYTLQGGDPGNQTARADGGFMFDYLAQGYTIVTSDYEGPTDDFGAGRESGMATLDAIRAAQSHLRLKASSTPVALVGYSGGSIASEWASELQPRYAPQLRVVGVAIGGIPADFAHNLAYIDGSTDWAGAIPAITLGVARAYHLDLKRYGSAKGRQIVAQVARGCLNPGAYPGLRFEDLLKPRYKDYKRDPKFVRIFNDSIMGRKGRTPHAPVFMAVGNKDGTGDGVMVAKDVQELAHTYCARGVPVQFHEYDGQDHTGAAIHFEPEAASYVAQRYAAQPPPNDCATIAAGNALTPLPKPNAAPRLRLAHLRRHGGRLTVRVRARGGRVRHVRIRVLRLRHGHATVAGHRTLKHPVGAHGRRVRVPLRHAVAGARYRIVARGRHARRAALTFRAR